MKKFSLTHPHHDMFATERKWLCDTMYISWIFSMATTIVWFRNCLRLHDNLSLLEASKSENVVCLFMFTPSVYNSNYMGINRFQFLLESLQDLQTQLRKKYNGDLILVKTNSSYRKAFETLLKSNASIKKIVYEYDSTPYAKKRDESIKNFVHKEFPDVKFLSFQGHTLTDLDKVVNQKGFKNPSNTKMMIKLMLNEYGKSSKSSGINIPAPLNAPLKLKFNSNLVHEIEKMDDSITVLKKVPELHELNDVFGDEFKDIDVEAIKKHSYFKGGETEALRRLREKVLDNADFVCNFEKPKTSCVPSSESMFREPSTTGLSPYLAAGCLSVRMFWDAVDKSYQTKKHVKVDNLTVSLYGQLLFREMFYILNEAIGEKFSQNTKSNPAITKYIDWNEQDPVLLQAWKDGKTGYPFIDALMRQMKATGWMHHLGRHAVSCFLTRGQMFQNWTYGRDVFDRLLIDSDYSLNTGNWLWLAGIAPYSMPYFRVYSPCPEETKKSALNFNKGGNEFIRYWVPELANFPTKYLTKPWECPVSAQKMYGVIIGKDYPKPIVERKNTNLEKFRVNLMENRLKTPHTSPPSKKQKL